MSLDTRIEAVTARIIARSQGPRKTYLDRMRAAAADLEFEEAGRLRDEIRRLENDELGLLDADKRAAPKGKSTEGRPGTRKMRYGKTQRKFGK